MTFFIDEGLPYPEGGSFFRHSAEIPTPQILEKSADSLFSVFAFCDMMYSEQYSKVTGFFEKLEKGET